MLDLQLQAKRNSEVTRAGRRTLLLEIGLEEMPASLISDASDQLAMRLCNWLDEHRILYAGAEALSTPRRLSVLIQGVAERQEQMWEEVRGPAKSIALDKDGNWTKAALGFAKNQSVRPEHLVFREQKGGTYLFAVKEQEGEAVAELLPGGLKQVVEALSFPRSMRWGEERLKYIRPIRWLVSLFGQETVDFKVAGVASGRTSRGHRFLGGECEIGSADAYLSALYAQSVMVRPDARKDEILRQVEEIVREKAARGEKWHVPIDPNLLDEVVNLVEWPTVLTGGFDQDFLELPDEVLITSMKEHQRYFPVKDVTGRLLPYFVTVRNGNADHIDTVQRGNEKVLRARLSDARFFFEEDQKMPISTAVSKLEHVVFHEGLGTVGDKIRRLQEIAANLASCFDMKVEEKSALLRAAEICKFDLQTQMVNEFPELQGKMGMIYAKLAGEREAVAKAIYEHYLPRFAGDELPKNPIGQVLSVADKLDALVGFFSLNLIPTGSEDPYALRRQANGVVQILCQAKWAVKTEDLLRPVFEAYEKNMELHADVQNLTEKLIDFLKQRLKNVLQEREVRYDCIDAALAVHEAPLVIMALRAQALQIFVECPENREALEAFTRVNNIVQQANEIGKEAGHFNAQDFEEPAEQVLYRHVQEVRERYLNKSPLSAEEQLSELSRLAKPVHCFFEEIMVMVEDEAVRGRRLALLQEIAGLLKGYADFRRLVL